MNGENCETARLNADWASMCNAAQSNGAMLARMCSRPFADLITEEIRKFCEQTPPANKDEAQARMLQRTYLASKTGSISNAETMARMTPHRATDILNEVQEFCERVPLSGEVISEATLLTGRIQAICNG